MKTNTLKRNQKFHTVKHTKNVFFLPLLSDFFNVLLHNKKLRWYFLKDWFDVCVVNSLIIMKMWYYQRNVINCVNRFWEVWLFFNYEKYVWFLNFLNYKKYEIIMFVNYENNVYTKHHKTFSKNCVLENDFFVYTKHLKTFSNYFQGCYQTQENKSVFLKMLFRKWVVFQIMSYVETKEPQCSTNIANPKFYLVCELE